MSARSKSHRIHSLSVLSKVVVKGMIERGEGGAIVHISSIAHRMTLKNNTAYCSSKGAVESLTRVMALELGPHQVIRFKIHLTMRLLFRNKHFYITVRYKSSAKS